MAPTQEVFNDIDFSPGFSLPTHTILEVRPLVQQFEFPVINPYDVNADIPHLPNLENILRVATGSENLSEVTEVKLKVVSQDVGLQHLPVHLPVLRELILDGSVISSLRDLGYNLRSLKTLRVNRCTLTSLDGINGVKNLEELYAADNYITDLTACTTLDYIRKIDVKRNKLKDVNTLSFLTLCERLEHLELDDNPNLSNLFGYRDQVKKLIPKLKSLDGFEYPEEVKLPESPKIKISEMPPQFLTPASPGKARLPDTSKKMSKTPTTLPAISPSAPFPLPETPRKMKLPPLNKSDATAPATPKTLKPPPALKSSGATSRGSYSVSFSPRVLSPRTEQDDTNKDTSSDIKVKQNKN